MSDIHKSREELTNELNDLRDRVKKLESQIPDEMLSQIFHQMPMGIWAVDREMRLTCYFVGGLNPLDLKKGPVVGKKLELVIGDPRAKREILEKHNRVLSGETLNYEIQVSGRVFGIHMNPLLNSQKKIIGVAGSAMDITELAPNADLKTVEVRELLRDKALLERAQKVIHIGYWERDFQNDRFLVSKEAGEIYGLTPGEWTGKWMKNIPLREYRSMLDEKMQDLIEKNEPYNVQYKICRRSDGAIADIHSIAEYDPIGKRVFGVIQDITDKKKAEEALRESEEKYRQLAESSNALICEINTEADFLYINPAFKDILGYEPSDLLGHKVFEIGKKDDYEVASKKLEEAALPSNKQRNVWNFKDKWGNWHFLDCFSHSYVHSSGETRINTVSFDITEIKKTENLVRESLREKEVLIRELYHRTKNNMQVIISMLALQASQSRDEEVKNQLKELQNRIHSMALVHQKLYQSKSLASINLKEYITDLTALMMNSYHVHGEISLKLDLEDVFVRIDIAIPCGLVLNELISNALKYAFPDNRKGQLEVVLHRLNGEDVEICVRDDGAGFPRGFDFKKDGKMGLNTILSVGENQMQGKVVFNTKNGVECRLTFKDTLFQSE